MSFQPDHTTRRLVALAQRQHGVLLRTQILAMGESDDWLRARLRSGWLRVYARGVYLLAGSPISHRTRASAATLAIPGSVVSHELAAVLHAFPVITTARPTVTVPPGRGHASRLARMHEYDGITEHDIVHLDGIPMTSVALTLFHLSATQPVGIVDSILEDLIRMRRVRIQELHALHDYWTRLGRPRRKVMTKLLLTRGPGYVVTDSELERAFLALVARFGLPTPTPQFEAPWLAAVGGRVDAAFVTQRLIVETDGRKWHTRQQELDRDRARDRSAAANGYLVLRYGYEEVVYRPAAVAAELCEVLGARSAVA